MDVTDFFIKFLIGGVIGVLFLITIYKLIK